MRRYYCAELILRPRKQVLWTVEMEAFESPRVLVLLYPPPTPSTSPKRLSLTKFNNTTIRVQKWVEMEALESPRVLVLLYPPPTPSTSPKRLSLTKFNNTTIRVQKWVEMEALESPRVLVLLYPPPTPSTSPKRLSLTKFNNTNIRVQKLAEMELFESPHVLVLLYTPPSLSTSPKRLSLTKFNNTNIRVQKWEDCFGGLGGGMWKYTRGRIITWGRCEEDKFIRLVSVPQYVTLFGVSVNISQHCNAASMYSTSGNIYNGNRGRGAVANVLYVPTV